MSAAAATGTRPITSPLDGETTQRVSAEPGSRQAPSMNRREYSVGSIFFVLGWLDQLSERESPNAAPAHQKRLIG